MKYIMLIGVALLVSACSSGDNNSKSAGFDGDYTLSPESNVVSVYVKKMLKDVGEVQDAISEGIKIDARNRRFLEEYGFINGSTFVSKDEANEIAKKEVMKEFSTGNYQIATLKIRDSKFSYSKYEYYRQNVRRICTIKEVNTFDGVVCTRDGFDDEFGIFEVNDAVVSITIDDGLETIYIKN